MLDVERGQGDLRGIRTGCDQGIDDASAVTFAVLSAPQARLSSDLGADLDGSQQSHQLIEHLLFPQALEEDDVAFVRRAQEEKLLLVPGSGFGWPGCFRLSYCCPSSVIENSREAWLRLVESYR